MLFRESERINTNKRKLSFTAIKNNTELIHSQLIKGGGKHRNFVTDTLLLMKFPWVSKRGNICCGQKVFLKEIRNNFCVSDTNSVSSTNVARAGKQGNHCVRNNVSTFATAFILVEGEFPVKKVLNL